MVHLLGTVALVLAACGIAVTALWGGIALGYRGRGGVALRTLTVTCWAAFSVAMSAALVSGHWAVGVAGFAAGLAGVITWWSRLRPADDGDWADDVARPTTGTIDGNRVTLQNVRNFDWRSTDDYTPRWETRGYDLDGVGSVDMIMSYWRGPSIAHMLVSFGFGDRSQVVFSVEVRRRKSQQFSEIAGFFKEFELCIIAADELDIVHLRTNVRGERVYLYRLLLSRPAMRELFMGYVAEANRLHRAPRFYNTLTVNCTTLVYQMLNRIVGGLPLSYRLLYSGYMPEYMYGVGRLDGRHSLQELRDRGFVTERARQSGRSPTFSADIRKGVPGTDGAACGPLAP